jgi:hypothetical protein
MVAITPQLTRLGLPPVLSSTLRNFWYEAMEKASEGYEPQMTYMAEQIQRIGRRDPQYERMLKEMFKHHEEENWDLSVSELTSEYLLLERSGELPRIKKDKLDERLEIDIGKPHFINMLNVGKNMPVVEQDNPLLYQVIRGVASRREGIESRSHVMADHSTAYMLLVESL